MEKIPGNCKIFQFGVLVFFVFFSCDPKATLLLKNGSDEKIININNTTLSFSLDTMHNIHFGVLESVNTKDSIQFFLDSLKIFFNDNQAEYYILYKGKEYEKLNVNLNKESDIFRYGFYYKGDKILNIGDKVTIKAQNYIKIDDEYFDIGPIDFFITRRFKP